MYTTRFGRLSGFKICHRYAVASETSAERDASPGWEQLQSGGFEETIRVVSAAMEIGDLRRLAASQACRDVWRLSDRQVLEEVASRVTRGELLLFAQADVSEPRHRLPSHKPVANHLSEALTPGQHWPTEHTKQSPSAPLPDIPTFEPVDDASQAATLRLASAGHFPFYAPCKCATPLPLAAVVADAGD